VQQYNLLNQQQLVFYITSHVKHMKDRYFISLQPLLNYCVYNPKPIPSAELASVSHQHTKEKTPVSSGRQRKPYHKKTPLVTKKTSSGSSGAGWLKLWWWYQVVCQSISGADITRQRAIATQKATQTVRQNEQRQLLLRE
jgi:hypothetical protein